MPKIYSDNKKQLLYKIIKENCIHTMRENGYKQLNIRDLTKMTGISTGTFYNFYHSKEDLILAIMEESQHNLEKRFLELFRSNGSVTKSKFIELYTFFFLEDEMNIFRYLSRDDLTNIFLRVEKIQSLVTIKYSMKKNIKYIDKPKQYINFSAVINFTQLVNFCLENDDLLVRDEMENTIKKLLENIADEIFEEDI